MKVSELGVGGHEYRRSLPTSLGRWGEIDMEKFTRTQPERTRLIKRAIDAGVNYFDPTHLEEVKSLGSALKELGVKEDIHVSVMVLGLFGKMAESSCSKWRQIIIEDVEEKLKSLQMNYADILTILFAERNYSPERLTAALEVFSELKEEGRIGFFGASTHEPRFLAELMRRHDCFDMVMVRYNYHLQEAHDAIFPLAKALEVGVVVIKPFAWPYYGIPFMRFGPVEAEEGPYTPAQTSLHWILKSPEVSTVVAGMNSQAELEENQTAFTKEG
ncbi:MAG: aldo/keto reductase [Candidatus Bathyarchaeia archaeon]